LISLIVSTLIITYIIPAYGAPFGFDKQTYTWTDKIFIRIVAPDFNFDRHAIDEIGGDSFNPIKISTRGHTLDHYKLVETGPSTGIFTGEIILTGFCHDADGNSNTGTQTRNSKCNIGDDTNPRTEPSQNGGPTNGFLEADNDDGITVSFEYTENQTVLGSAPIRWNVGDIQWHEANYPSTGTGIIRVIDPDMNLNPEAIDNFDIDVWSESDVGGIDLTVTETGEMTGIFEGRVFFTTTNESSGNRLLVSEGDIVTAEYEDNTLPDPYTIADELDISATSSIGEVISNLQTISVDNTRISDRSGNPLSEISTDQSIQIAADLQNNTVKDQAFTYLVQISDENEVTVYLAWITGILAPGQTLSPSLSWSSQSSGMYDATMFVWRSVNNPVSLSTPVSLTVDVN
jgi:hypothetical protein